MKYNYQQMYDQKTDTDKKKIPCLEITSLAAFRGIMAWVFTEYDVGGNSQVLHWNFSIPRATSYSVNSQAIVCPCKWLMFKSFNKPLAIMAVYTLQKGL